MEFEDKGKKIRSRVFKEKIEAAYFYATDPSASGSRRQYQYQSALPHDVSSTPSPPEATNTADESSATSGLRGVSDASDLIEAMLCNPEALVSEAVVAAGGAAAGSGAAAEEAEEAEEEGAEEEEEAEADVEKEGEEEGGETVAESQLPGGLRGRSSSDPGSDMDVSADGEEGADRLSHANVQWDTLPVSSPASCPAASPQPRHNQRVRVWWDKATSFDGRVIETRSELGRGNTVQQRFQVACEWP